MTTTDTPSTPLNMLRFQQHMAQLVTEMGPIKANAALEEMLTIHNMVIEAFDDPTTRLQCLDEALEVHRMMEDAAHQGADFPAMQSPSLAEVRDDAAERAYRATKPGPVSLNTAVATVYAFPPPAT